MFLLKLLRALKAAKLDYALVGGYAVALHGAVRGTVDIDLVLKQNQRAYTTLEKVLNQLGLVSKLPVTGREVFNFRDEYIKNRNLTAWCFTNPNNPIEIVDIIITHDLKDIKKKIISFQDLKIKIASIDDLIKMKSKSQRKQDQEDVKALKQLKEQR